MKLGRTLLFLTVLLFMMMIPVVYAQPRVAEGEFVSIMDAYNDNLDDDHYEDDIKILVEFTLSDESIKRIDLELLITLPSGTKYSFRIIIYYVPDNSVLNIDCIDMAYENGWYTVDMQAVLVGTGSGKVVTTDSFSFDPPTGGGPGLPSVIAYF